MALKPFKTISIQKVFQMRSKHQLLVGLEMYIWSISICLPSSSYIGPSYNVMFSKLNNYAIVGEFISYLVHHIPGLMPNLAKIL